MLLDTAWVSVPGVGDHLSAVLPPGSECGSTALGEVRVKVQYECMCKCFKELSENASCVGRGVPSHP